MTPQEKLHAMRRVGITTEYIRLDDAMKLANIVGRGGMAKHLIQEGAVEVNGVTCTERGKKLRPGDKFTYLTVEFRVESDVAE